MCYEHYHDCKYCKIHYVCSLPNRQCPTVNFDFDMKMCDTCRLLLEKLVDRFTFEDALNKLKEIHD